ncbi:hypothetical protein [Polyangium sp. 15x6]|uniref:hypothetical protein n=1 Tax=Polyangium sp. 15x6 TaxID=3042687 RepID=UPI00249BC7FC|nr:hypothetical protein [Polyangium sp. 15x6]MDI3282096.1 hypothetical protein [Polyangium sp. 15x6]
MSYAGYKILRRRATFWIARRRTKTAIHQIGPARSLREIQAEIDRRNAELPWEELIEQ